MGKSKNKPPLRARWKTMEAAIGMEIREHKGSFAVYVVLRVLVIAVAVLKFFNGDYEAVFLCILTPDVAVAAGARVRPSTVPHRTAVRA